MLSRKGLTVLSLPVQQALHFGVASKRKTIEGSFMAKQSRQDHGQWGTRMVLTVYQSVNVDEAAYFKK